MIVLAEEGVEAPVVGQVVLVAVAQMPFSNLKNSIQHPPKAYMRTCGFRPLQRVMARYNS